MAICLLSACTVAPTTVNKENTDVNQAKTVVVPTPSLQEQEIPPTSLQPFLAKVSQDQNIPLTDLQAAFADTRVIPSIRKLVLPAPTGFQKNWRVYRSRFVEPKRLMAGHEFWKKHRAFIEKTSKKTGVPAEVIVSIIGVETIYGKHMGDFPVKNTLVTLGFDYPDTPNRASREILFKEQLRDLITLCWKEDSKPTSFKACLNQTGSYAGAIGLPQFMPGSVLRFGVDGNQDGKIDLRNTPEDAIASVGNFLKNHGWVEDEPIYLSINDTPEAMTAAATLSDGEPVAKLLLGDLVKASITSGNGLKPETPSLIVDLPSPNNQGGTDIKYVVGLSNFVAICNYNRSYFYAQSVAEFAEALQGDAPIIKTRANTAKKSVKKVKKASKKPSSKTLPKNS